MSRFLDLRRHAAALRLGAAAYVSGGRDRGILPDETRDLAARAGARHLVVPRADHLGAVLEAPDEVVALASRPSGRPRSESPHPLNLVDQRRHPLLRPPRPRFRKTLETRLERYRALREAARRGRS